MYDGQRATTVLQGLGSILGFETNQDIPFTSQGFISLPCRMIQLDKIVSETFSSSESLFSLRVFDSSGICTMY